MFRSRLFSLLAVFACCASSVLTASAASAQTDPYVGVAYDPAVAGFWLVTASGHVEPRINAPFYGDVSHLSLNAPVTGIVATNDGHGYWLVAKDGGVFAFGDAPFYGSMGSHRLNAPVTGIVATNDGHGYWLVAKDGGVFAFGDAPFYGSLYPDPVPAVSIINLGAQSGYQIVNADGSMAALLHSKGGGQPGLGLSSPVVAMVADPATKEGYWLLTRDGIVRGYNGAPWFSDLRIFGSHSAAVGMATSPRGDGYLIVTTDGIYALGDVI